MGWPGGEGMIEGARVYKGRSIVYRYTQPNWKYFCCNYKEAKQQTEKWREPPAIELITPVIVTAKTRNISMLKYLSLVKTMHDVNFLFHIVFSHHPWCEKDHPISLGFHMVISHCFSHMPMWKSKWNFHMSFTWSSHAFHMVYSSSEYRYRGLRKARLRKHQQNMLNKKLTN